VSEKPRQEVVFIHARSAQGAKAVALDVADQFHVCFEAVDGRLGDSFIVMLDWVVSFACKFHQEDFCGPDPEQE
jgi:hypothetical protein